MLHKHPLINGVADEDELEKGKERKWEKKRKGVKLRWHEGERERER